MAIELKIPEVGESITEAMIGEWLKKEGDSVEQDELLVVIETDKVTVELPSPQAGVLEKILKGNGEDAEIGEVIGYLRAAGEAGGETSKPAESDASEKKPEKAEKPAKAAKAAKGSKKDEAPEPAAEPEATETEAEPAEADAADTDADTAETDTTEPRVMPAARRMLEEAGLDASAVTASGPGGRLLKEDVQRHLEGQGDQEPAARAKPATEAPSARQQISESAPVTTGGHRQEEAVRMTPLRRRVASRLVEAQQAAALLTTFNEIDMSEVMALRKRYQERFVERHGIKLGFMSFFVKAAVEALKEIPAVNAEIRGEEIVYRNYADIGIAVGGGKGLVVPVIRNAERLSFAEVEKTIADLARRAQDSKLKLEELQGGTFTISNGGIYGSLLSTPIVNPPQSGILGMHAIQDRPMAVDGQVVIRPMMYVALTYDHRLIDGREAVTFLIRLKERVEDPTRILIEA